MQLGDLGTVAHLDGSMEITEGDNRYLSRYVPCVVHFVESVEAQSLTRSLVLRRRELLEGNRNNLRAGDIFALGATIYELALGTTLASGGEEWQKIRDGDLVMFRCARVTLLLVASSAFSHLFCSWSSQYSNSLQHLIASMMHPDALQRPLAEDILQHEVVLPFR